MADPKYRLETLAVHAGQEQPDSATQARAVPVYRTSSYVFKDTGHAARLFALEELGNIYSRIMNPTVDVLEKRVAAMEGGAAALALASGMSAIFNSIINVAKPGDEIVSGNNLYGGTYSLLANFLPTLGIRTRFVNVDQPDQFRAAINEKTRALFVETIGNPVLDVCDLDAVVEIAGKHHLPVIVDNTFATPYLCRPIEHGCPIVIHSLTKWLGGHGTGIGGVVADSGTFDWSDRKFDLYNTPTDSYHGMVFSQDLGDLTPIAFLMRMRLVALRTLGACISPDNAWMFLQGIESLHVRFQRHCDNALAVAQWLQKHPRVEWVRYPGLPGDRSHAVAKRILDSKKGFGSMVVFGIKGGREAGERFINRLQLISHLANVGDAKSLALHPASTSHSQLTEEQQRASGLVPELVRLSIGIEHVDDIIGDIEQGLK